MSAEHAWRLIERARSGLPAPADAEDVVERLSALLVRCEPAEIRACAQSLWGLFTRSYRGDLWAAAYVINGGASDDGFDYFRGWLIAQGRDAYERALASPDDLAGHPDVVRAAEDGDEVWCEDMLGVAWRAYETVTGTPLPDDALSGRYPELDPEWDFDFDDAAEISRRLPRLAALFGYGDAGG